ncbi:MAG: cytochrome c [Bacteroidetes bacterium]|nr:cytochrome c [Bacteroidota bacterium]
MTIVIDLSQTQYMKKIVRFLLYTVLLVIVVAGGFVGFLQVRGIPKYDAPQIPEFKAEATPERIVQGTKIASVQCMVCHKDSNNRLTGRFLSELPDNFGKIYSANITHSKEHGIGSWTDSELAYFLRTGVRKNGQYAPIYMPKFAHLSDEDLKSVIAWLRSDDPQLQATEKPTTPPVPSLFTKFLCLVAFKPLPYPTAPIAQPDTTNAIAYGKYLVTGRYDCYTCHSADFAKLNMQDPEKSLGYCQGGNTMLTLASNKIYTANITPDEKTGIGNWTEDDFRSAMHESKNKAGHPLRFPMLPYTALTDNEVHAIWQYLRTVPKIENDVNRQYNIDLDVPQTASK